jgi:hypothetical protein
MNAISRQPKITKEDIDFTPPAPQTKRDDYFDHSMHKQQWTCVRIGVEDIVNVVA